MNGIAVGVSVFFLIVRIGSQHASIELAFQLRVTRIAHLICEMYRGKI